MQTEVLTICYWATSMLALFVYFRGQNFKSLAGLGIFAAIYYSQNLYWGSAEAFHGVNADAEPHWSIYFFYTLVLLALALAAHLENRQGYLQGLASSNDQKKLNRLKFLYNQQLVIFLALMLWKILSSGIDITNKQDFLDSKNIFFLLSILTAYPLCILSVISERFNPLHLTTISALLFLSFLLGYRGVIAELFFIILVSSYYFGKDFFFTKKRFFFLFSVLGFVVLAPAKYFMALIYSYINNGQFEGIDLDQMLLSMKSGNEASGTIGIVDIIVKSDIQLPDFYFFHSVAQHIPFIREIFPIERYSFNSFFQDKLFGDWDFGVGSSAVANMYIAGNVSGLLFLVFFVFFLTSVRTKKFYFVLMGLSTIPGYLFFMHRSDWDQIFFVASIFFYTSIIPFGIYTITSSFNLSFISKKERK